MRGCFLPRAVPSTWCSRAWGERSADSGFGRTAAPPAFFSMAHTTPGARPTWAGGNASLRAARTGGEAGLTFRGMTRAVPSLFSAMPTSQVPGRGRRLMRHSTGHSTTQLLMVLVLF
ncbi:hypothetical protein NDU88_001971 [Pleurodeles waltl]|uniref:Secreted protein n=1 Tax=Pleurodeles waltl TaxID=8319 RepID=A0AAV7Q7L2_PLEWA|nr:hypothetical protein NDU88_001971 [Pleurodeles waltl]